MRFHQIRKKMADLVDLEWFLNDLEKEEPTDFRGKSAFLPGMRLPADLPDAECLDRWLAAKRRERLDRGLSLPGRKVLWGLDLLLFSAILLSLAAGLGISLGILRYDGNLPVNLLYAFSALVLLPLATVLVTLLVLLLYRKRMPFAHSLLLRGAGKLFSSVLAGMDAALPAEKRENALVPERQIADFLKKYAPLVRALLFFIFQLGGFFLVAGMFAAFLVKVAGSDLAFAWQSTLNIKPEALARFLGILGAPWKALLPEAVPTLAQIEGSRIFLKEGIAGLEGAHLAAWWGFMAMALFVYGLFPRFLLLIFAGFGLRKKTLASLPDDSRTRALCFFLRRSPSTGEGGKSFWDREVVPERDKVSGEGEELSVPGPWELWIGDEIPEEAKRDLEDKTMAWMGSKPERVLVMDTGSVPDSGNFLSLVFCLEVFMPPVLEDLEALKSIAEKRKNLFMIWPVGRKDAHPPYEPSQEDLLIWGKKLRSLPEPRPLLMRRSHEK